GLGAAEIDQDGNTARRPGLLDRQQDPLHIGAEPAVGIAAAMGDLYFVPHHLAHHIRGAAGDLGRMRHDDYGNVLARHFDPSKKGDKASTRISLDRAPGSMWPMLRSPRNEARPLLARMGTVAAAPPAAALRSRGTRSALPWRAASSTGTSTSSMV